jgi:23S rRNA (uracil1939-C5)-methyltransferase
VATLADGSPVYMAGPLPGEMVHARPLEKRGEGWAAAVDASTELSPERTAAPCPHFGTCGGCALQQWQLAPYMAWKSGLLDAALRRAGYAPNVVPMAITPPRMRRRMDFAIRRQGNTIILGLHEARGASIVDVQLCEVLHPTLAALLVPLRDVLRTLSLLRREGSVVANLLDSGPDLLLRTDAPATAADRVRLAAFAIAHGVPRITLAEGRTALETACLLRPATTSLSGTTVSPPPGGFLQASAAGEAAIIAAVLAGLPDRLPARAKVVELFAGCGTLTFALAGVVRVVAYESDAPAISALKAATNAASLNGRIDPQRRDLVRQPLSVKEFSGFAAVVLNPPHAGAAAQIPAIAASRMERVVYISCNPASLSRDATLLQGAGFELLATTPIDQFLWSARLESVSVFAR